MKLYLAGPDVFLPDAVATGARKKALCAAYGWEGLFPLDQELGGMSGHALAMGIYQGNRGLMDAADAIIANFTPFRGPSMDPGTAFEVGYMAARHKPVFGYSAAERPYAARVTPTVREDGTLYDEARFAVEDFGLADNLMMAGALDDTGLPLVIRAPNADTPSDRLRALEAFEACLQEIAAR